MLHNQKIWEEQADLFHKLLSMDEECISCSVITATKYQVLNGGKRIRALLPPLLAKSINPEIKDDYWNAAIWCGLAVELTHSAGLCHDDIMDEDATRRKQPSVWVKFGMKQAVITGDYLFFLAKRAIQQSHLSDRDKLQVLLALQEEMLRGIRGQSLEFDFAKDFCFFNRTTYTQAIRCKTGGLLALSFLMGCICAKADAKLTRNIHQLAFDIGETYQVVDDLLDITNQKDRLEKDCDLWEGKPSWIVMDCCENLSETDRSVFLSRLYTHRSQKTEQDIVEIKNTITNTDSIEKGFQYIEEMQKKLTTKIEKLPPKVQQTMNNLVDKIIHTTLIRNNHEN